MSLTGSALSTLNTAHNKVASAANDIARFGVRADEVGGNEVNNTDLVKPVVSMAEAELQNSAGVKLLAAEKNMIGSLLDTKA